MNPTETPLSHKEQAQWMLHRLMPGRGVTNVGFAMRVDTVLRWWPLQEALNHVVRRHSALRIEIRDTGARPTKRVAPEASVVVPLDVHTASDADLDEQLTKLFAVPLDVTRAPLVHAHLITVPSGSVVCLVAHHLVFDAITAQVVLGELITLYDAYADGREPPVDLASPTRSHVEHELEPKALDYWVQHLEGTNPADMALATARPITGKPTFAGDRLRRPLSTEAVAAVERLRSDARTTENIVLLAAYYLLLARHGAGPDLVVGVPVNARQGGADDGVVGFHVNTLPIRVAVDLDKDFAELLDATMTAFLSGAEHASASFESVQHLLGTRSPDWRVPLFRHAFNYRPVYLREWTVAGAVVRDLDAYNGMSRLDLELTLHTSPGRIEVAAVFSNEVHDRADVAAMLDRYETLLCALAPGTSLRDVEMWTESDHTVVRSTNDVSRDWSGETVLGLVARAVRRTPDAPAIGTWTYRTLWTSAARVRDLLYQHGVVTGDLVGLHAGRGPWLAAAVLGTWLAGVAYLPVDPAHPAERVTAHLVGAGVRVVLTDRDAQFAPSTTTVRLDTVAVDDSHWDVTVPDVSGDLAYVIHTSGSTGRPKGVEIGHVALANVVRHFVDLLQVGDHDRIAWLTTFAFDISALELLMALTTGACLVPVDDNTRMDPSVLATQIETATVVQATPTTWQSVVSQLAGRLPGHRVLCGGEPLGPALAEQLLATGAVVHNAYGPTETTIWSTVETLNSAVDGVPIGRPIANTTVHVLDPEGASLPPGLPGELCIGGAGLAFGYRADPDQTAARFRDDPDIGRYYRTGDQVYQRPDGTLVFLGRTDRQVKVRGHRIELAEVEGVLAEHPAVLSAAVHTERDTAGHLRLVAAVRSLQPVPDDLSAQLRDHALTRLPNSAVPARFVVLDAFPTTANGKVDHRAVQAMTVSHNGPSALPEDPTLRTLVECWRAVLGDGTLSEHANFFLAGGHSLLAGRLADRISADTGHDLDFRAVFEAPTPAALAVLLGRRDS
jgi:amino acid adenylation domain-containing protein